MEVILPPHSLSGAPGVSEGVTTVSGNKSTSEDSAAPGTTPEGPPGMAMGGLKPLLTDLREVASTSELLIIINAHTHDLSISTLMGLTSSVFLSSAQR